MIFGAWGKEPILKTAKQLQEKNTKSEKQKDRSSSRLLVQDPPQKKPSKAVTQDPSPVQPQAPTPVQAQSPAPGKPEANPPKPRQEDQITLQGKIDLKNWSGKIIRIDIFDGDQQKIGGKRPSVVATRRIKDPQNFTISVPKTSNSLWVGAYVDEDEDGRPGGKDPSGWYGNNPIAGDKNHQNILIPLAVPKEPQQ